MPVFEISTNSDFNKAFTFIVVFSIIILFGLFMCTLINWCVTYPQSEQQQHQPSLVLVATPENEQEPV